MKNLLIALFTMTSLCTYANESALVSPNVLNVTICSSYAAVCSQLPVVVANPHVIASATWAPVINTNFLYFGSKVDSDFYAYTPRENGHIFATTNNSQEYYGHPSQVSTIAFGNFSKKPVTVQVFIQQTITSHPEFYASAEVPSQTREFLNLKRTINPYRIYFKLSHEMIRNELQVLYKR